MGTDEDYYGGERAFKKPSLSTRLQGGMNLQICFMNDAAVAADETEVTSAITTTSSSMASSSQSHHNLRLTAVTSATSLSSSPSYSSSSKSQQKNSQVTWEGERETDSLAGKQTSCAVAVEVCIMCLFDVFQCIKKGIWKQNKIMCLFDVFQCIRLGIWKQNKVMWMFDAFQCIRKGIWKQNKNFKSDTHLTLYAVFILIEASMTTN